ncbi:MAG TPA: family 1 glycosylhydrolase [Desulfitobacteriaceae bacterium]|nr:family 1 glycosylhydrolase [Desulfitobacteriaceae bacterium]
MSFELKQGLLLGVSSSAMQIEGGECGHSWNNWYHQGKIKDGSDPARATDHYNRWQEDADLMAALGIKNYRLSIEWARLCPTEDTVDAAAVAHYREELTYLRAKGISLLLTIHHFSNPLWFEQKGGFAKAENIKYYLDLVALVIRSLGDLVAAYLTINEPNIYAVNGYYYGSWPPGEKSLGKALTVMANLALCHIRAYGQIHKIRREMGYQNTKVSFANHMRIFEPANPHNPWHRICAFLLEHFFQGAVTEAFCLGKFSWPLKVSAPPACGGYCDFIALNYYTRSTVSGFRDGVREAAPKNDLGWEIYPQGLTRCLEKLYRVLQRPIYITENGTCDNNDAFRCRYIYEHLKAICLSDLPIERYYHWCFCDNFELLEGESARFGLVHIDFESQKRMVKRSGNFLAEVISAGGVNEKIYEKYVQNQAYHL